MCEFPLKGFSKCSPMGAFRVMYDCYGYLLLSMEATWLRVGFKS